MFTWGVIVNIVLLIAVVWMVSGRLDKHADRIAALERKSAGEKGKG